MNAKLTQKLYKSNSSELSGARHQILNASIDPNNSPYLHKYETFDETMDIQVDN